MAQVRYTEFQTLPDNLKLLPLGRLYDGPDDIYPDILEARLRLLPHNS